MRFVPNLVITPVTQCKSHNPICGARNHLPIARISYAYLEWLTHHHVLNRCSTTMSLRRYNENHDSIPFGPPHLLSTVEVEPSSDKLYSLLSYCWQECREIEVEVVRLCAIISSAD